MHTITQILFKSDCSSYFRNVLNKVHPKIMILFVNSLKCSVIEKHLFFSPSSLLNCKKEANCIKGI